MRSPFGGNTLIVAISGGLLAGVFVPFAAYAPIFPLENGWELVRRESTRWVSGSFQMLPSEDVRERDVVLLKNGDSLSGEVLRIEDDVVHFAAEMLEGEVRIPFTSLTRVEFRRRASQENVGEDEIALVEGGCFGASIERMDEKNLSFRTLSSGNFGEIALSLDQVASIGLGCEPRVLLEAEFEDSAAPFVPDGGEWVVHEGQLLQSDPNQHGVRAYVRVAQWGRLRYLWTLDSTDWGTGGMCILAAHPTASAQGSSYRFHMERSRLTLYKMTEHGESQNFFCTVPSVKGRTRFRVEYNCETGRIGLWLNGKLAANLLDKSPIRSGEYVVLHAQGRAVFDDVRVEQFGGEPLVSDEEEQKGVVVLRNGDRILGHAREVTRSEVIIKGGEGETRVGRGRVSRVVLARHSSAPLEGGTVVFWNDNQLAGKVLSVDSNVLTLQTKVVGELSFDATQVKAIVFQE